jgi:hypothetical protein
VTGLRTNTKEQRMKEMRLHEREVLIERICVLDPMFRPPTDYVRKKPSAKLYIPYKVKTSAPTLVMCAQLLFCL